MQEAILYIWYPWNIFLLARCTIDSFAKKAFSCRKIGFNLKSFCLWSAPIKQHLVKKKKWYLFIVTTTLPALKGPIILLTTVPAEDITQLFAYWLLGRNVVIDYFNETLNLYPSGSSEGAQHLPLRFTTLMPAFKYAFSLIFVLYLLIYYIACVIWVNKLGYPIQKITMKT